MHDYTGHWITIWGLRSAWIKKLKRTDPHFFDPSTPKASNGDPMAREYFTRNHSYKNSYKQCKISYNLIIFYQIWKFLVSKEIFDPSTPKASNCNPMSCDYFICKFFKISAPLNLKCDKTFWGYNPLGMVDHIGF